MSLSFIDLPGQDYKSLREQMVKKQIKARGISDAKVLEAMQKVERHQFVPRNYLSKAYDDGPLPIGEGQTISQPYIVAYMTEILKLSGDEKVLEIGTGSGYQAAILGEVAKQVYTIEVIDKLGNKAKKLLKELGYKNIEVKVGDGYQGWKEHAPYDAIIVTCSPTHIPEALKEQLAEGGIMVIPVGQRFAQQLILLTKKSGKLVKKQTLAVRFVPMIDEEGKNY
ncbi:MAG: protein-L-isoaspartate(D-aspartate) O-methyltransferase [Bacteroidales bacterium]|nr:protein-L-isoaspartate(D-aspartate) O-methyltransferase [Bacteroidales bacterium]